MKCPSLMAVLLQSRGQPLGRPSSKANRPMSISGKLKEIKIGLVISCFIPLLLFWGMLVLRIPYSITYPFTIYSFGLFVITLLLYYFSLRLQGNLGVIAVLGLTMFLIALALSYKWTSGFSDNFMIGGLLPYKDAKNYYLGANLILNGLPVQRAGQAVERPLFPGFLSALLLVTGQNLKIALGIIMQLAGLGLYLSARQFSRSIGPFAASFYSTLMYFYIQPLIGYTLSELLGFMLGCFAFCLIWRVSYNLSWFDLSLGLITLLAAVSARAGAFIIFPMLAIWVGWIFRGEKLFSIKAAAYVSVVIVIGYLLINIIYARLLGIPPGSAFGNFSYALYGQVQGGTGWHSAIEELGTREPAIVYRAAWQFFFAHPTSLLIGFAKSYRDFFLPGNGSIFVFEFDSWRDWANLIMWAVVISLLLWGLIRLLKDIHSNSASLLLAGFVGVILSIPFLPPIDGGPRFYASTMAFFFVVPAIGFGQLTSRIEPKSISKNDWDWEGIASQVLSMMLILVTLIAPIGLHSLGRKPAYPVPSCPSQQAPFAVQIHPGSYVDLLKDRTTPSVLTPEVSLKDFEKNNTEKEIDDYYQILLLLTKKDDTNVRIIPAVDFVGDEFHYFYVSQSSIPDDSTISLIAGCAIEIRTKNQSIYEIKSIAIKER